MDEHSSSIDSSPAEPGRPTAVTEESAAQPQPAPWYRRRGPLAITAAVVAAAGIGIGIAATASSGPGTVTVHGTVAMGLLTYTDDAPGADVMHPDPGDPCTAGDGYSDIAPGTTVTIGGSTGQPVGTGALSAGKVTAAGTCSYSFSVSVPDQPSYTVTISHRGTTTWTKAQATSAAGITLSLEYTAG